MRDEEEEPRSSGYSWVERNVTLPLRTFMAVLVVIALGYQVVMVVLPLWTLAHGRVALGAMTLILSSLLVSHAVLAGQQARRAPEERKTWPLAAVNAALSLCVLTLGLFAAWAQWRAGKALLVALVGLPIPLSLAVWTGWRARRLLAPATSGARDAAFTRCLYCAAPVHLRSPEGDAGVCRRCSSRLETFRWSTLIAAALFGVALMIQSCSGFNL